MTNFGRAALNLSVDKASIGVMMLNKAFIVTKAMPVKSDDNIAGIIGVVSARKHDSWMAEEVDVGHG